MQTEQMDAIMETAVWIQYLERNENDNELMKVWRQVIPVSAYPPLQFIKPEKDFSEQWTLIAYDCQTGVVRNFAMKYISGWQVDKPMTLAIG